MVEIYNDVPFDLLVPLPKKKSAIKRVPFELKEDGHGLPYVKDLREICVTNADESFKLLTIGKRNLQISSTSLNQISSRSHCIFNMKLIKIDSQNDQMIAKISTNPDPKKHVIVPFRESKLFQNFLIGKGQASMIVQNNKLHNMILENIKAIKFSALTNQVVLLPVHAVTVTMKNEMENIGEPACKKKCMTIEWADEKEITESKKESLMNFGALTSMEYDEKDEINDNDFSDIDNDNQNTSREDVTIEQQADLQKELHENTDNYCLEGSKKAQLAYEKTISDLQEELKIAKLSSSEDVNCLKIDYETKIEELESKLKIALLINHQEVKPHLNNVKIINLHEGSKIDNFKYIDESEDDSNPPKVNENHKYKLNFNQNYCKINDEGNNHVKSSENEEFDLKYINIHDVPNYSNRSINHVDSKILELKNELQCLQESYIQNERNFNIKEKQLYHEIEVVKTAKNELNDKLINILNEKLRFNEIENKNEKILSQDFLQRIESLSSYIRQFSTFLSLDIKDENIQNSENVSIGQLLNSFDLSLEYLLKIKDYYQASNVETSKKLNDLFMKNLELNNYNINLEKMIAEMKISISALKNRVLKLIEILSLPSSSLQFRTLVEDSIFNNSNDIELMDLGEESNYIELISSRAVDNFQSYLVVPFKKQIKLSDLNNLNDAENEAKMKENFATDDLYLMDNYFNMNYEQNSKEMNFHSVCKVENRNIQSEMKHHDEAMEFSNQDDNSFLNSDYLDSKILNLNNNKENILSDVDSKILNFNNNKVNLLSNVEDPTFKIAKLNKTILKLFKSEAIFKKIIDELHYKIETYSGLLIESENKMNALNLHINSLELYRNESELKIKDLELNCCNYQSQISDYFIKFSQLKDENEELLIKNSHFQNNILSLEDNVVVLEQNKKNNQICDIENKKLIEQIKELHLRNKKLENLDEENKNKFHYVKFKLLNQIQINELFLQNLEESENSQKILSANDEIIESFNDNNIDLIKYLSSVLENDNENLIEQTIDLSNKKIELDNSNPLIEHCLVPQLESELNKINELKEQNTALLNLIKDLSHKKNIKLDDTNFSMENDLKTKLEQTKYINQLVNWNKDFINKIKISDIKIQNLKLEIQDMNAILVDKNNHEAKFMKEMLELKTELDHQKNLLCENDNLIKRIKEFEKQVEELKLLNNATNIKLLAEYENKQKISDLNDKISSLINSEILLRNENLIYYKTINDLKIKIQEIEKFNEHNDKNQNIDFKTTSIKKRNLKKTPKTLSEVPKCLHSQNISEDLVPKSLVKLTRSSKHSRRLNSMDEVYTKSSNDNIVNEVALDQMPRSNHTYNLRSKRSKI